MRQLWKDWQLFAEETGEEHVPDAGGQEAEDFEALIRGRYKEAFDTRVDYAVARTRQQMAQTIASGGSRVAENGGRRRSVSRCDPRELSGKELADIRRRVLEGEKIRF